MKITLNYNNLYRKWMDIKLNDQDINKLLNINNISLIMMFNYNYKILIVRLNKILIVKVNKT